MNGGTPYSSASSYGSYVNGGLNQQYSRVFDQGGQYGSIKGNGMIGAQGQRAGRRRRRFRTKKRRGGNVLSNAIVPLSILAMQQSYNPRTFSRRRFSRRRRPSFKRSYNA